ncbi:MAG: response regulator transcription factor [Pseudomonadales bacterium]|nr:response regulator transcription factor [Pseudomonadales bacterium]
MLQQSVIIVDDEPSARRGLCEVIQEFDSLKIIAEAGDGKSAVELIRSLNPDIVFLDIEMPEMSGFEVAKATTDMDYHLVFATAYEHYALTAFETQAIDYLLKPARPGRIKQCIDKILQQQKQALKNTESTHQNLSLLVDDGHKQFLIDAKDMAYIEAVGRYRRVHLTAIGEEIHARDTIITSTTLDEFSQQLSASDFMRIHRSFLINLAEIGTIQTLDRQLMVMLKGFSERPLTVSRTQVSALKQYVKKS